MELTSRESELLDQLKKREARSFNLRGWNIFAGILSYIGAACMAVTLEHLRAGNPATAILIFTIFYPTLLVMAFAGSVLLGTTIRDWNGNAMRVLLIKLIEEKAGHP